MTDTRPIVLVTGANGFVGRHVSGVLEDKAWNVRRAQRMLTGGEHEVQIGSIGPQTDWRAALDGASAVVHLAARVHHPNVAPVVAMAKRARQLARCSARV